MTQRVAVLGGVLVALVGVWIARWATTAAAEDWQQAPAPTEVGLPDDDCHLPLITESDLNQDFNPDRVININGVSGYEGVCFEPPVAELFTLPGRDLRRLAARFLLHPGMGFESAKLLLGTHYFGGGGGDWTDAYWCRDGVMVTIDENDQIVDVILSNP